MDYEDIESSTDQAQFPILDPQLTSVEIVEIKRTIAVKFLGFVWDRRLLSAGFEPDGSVMVCTGFQHGPLCGAGLRFKLSRADGGWKVVEKYSWKS